jgi:hypothetical protein
VLALLQQHDELLDQTARAIGIGTVEVHLVAAHDDARARERTLDLAEVDVTRPEQGRHHVGTGNDDGVRSGGRAHARLPDEGLIAPPG